MADAPEDTTPRRVTLTAGEDYLEATLQATSSLDHVKRQFQEILEICTDRRPSRLLVNMTAVSGKYSTLNRYDLGVMGSRLTPHVARVAALVSTEFIDPEKFGVRVARNRGLTLEVFVDREEALAWLRGPHPE